MDGLSGISSTIQIDFGIEPGNSFEDIKRSFFLQLILSNISRQAKAELCVIPDSMNKKGEYCSIVNLVR